MPASFLSTPLPEQPPIDMTGRLAVVTGSANGIGRATAQHLAARRAHVVLMDIEADPLAETVKAIQAAGGQATPLHIDLRERPAVIDAFARIQRDMAPVDILVNNVGQTARERITDFAHAEPQTWDFVIGLSLMTTLLCSRQVVPGMCERQRGKIVNVASDTPLFGDPMLEDYAAAKAGVIGFTRSLARELAPFGINVNAVSPGPTNTRGPRRMASDALARSLLQVPSGGLCEPEDVANCIGFLASAAARFISGQNLPVNARAFV